MAMTPGLRFRSIRSRLAPRLTESALRSAVLACIALLGLTNSSSAQTVELRPGTVVRFATVDEGGMALRAQDEFVERLSPFDRSARTKTEGSVTTASYLDFVAAQLREWADAERQRVTDLIASLKSRMEWVKAPLPAEILLIKASSEEEGGNPYTRGSVIVLPERLVQGGENKLEHVIPHELFHVLSRHNPSLRGKLYGLVGFELCNEIRLPESLAPRRITNPDAPRMDVMIEVEHQGRKVRVTPVLLSNIEKFTRAAARPFPVGYLDFKFAELEEDSGAMRIRAAGDAAVLLDPLAIKGFFEKVGRNTPYIIHPEEILADNFAMAVNEPPKIQSPEIIRAMKALLSKGS